ncbi:MAG TPA: nucleotidyltransferase domain-containing protein, partial [Ktedonobacteraceae bacterium]|nr:nucleotidyltransferase domain-containing protein [Ktedonobacteraceae bacterium]
MSSTLSEEFLSKLVAELDNDAVRAIILHGSYVRGDATPPYSDVDLARIVQETPDRTEHKQYTYRDGYLISISTRPLSIYQERLTVPEKAVFTVSGIQEARILLDKDGTFSVIQQEARAFRWELLQAAADNYAT